MTAHTPTGWRGVFRRLHLPLLLLILLCLLVNWGGVYRSLLYINFFGLLAYALLPDRSMPSGTCKPFRPGPLAMALLVIPVLFTGLHWIAVGHVEIIKELRHLWLAVFLAVSIWACGSQLNIAKGRLEKVLVLILGSYIVAQVVAVVIMGRPYGTTKNPHYLAFYSTLGLMLATYLFCRTHAWWRAVLLIMSPVFGYLILMSSSRPAWIALVLAILMFLLMVNVRSKRWMLVMLVLVPSLLFVANVGDFGSRLTELVQDIDHEERVVIWQNAWQMQQASHPGQWVWGHGLDSFREAFEQYSQYHGIVDFNSPHNSVFELLYLSGIVGLAGFILFYLLVYYQLWKLARRSPQPAAAGLMIAALTFNVLFISITIPVFTSYNLYVIGMVVGGIFWLRARGTSG